MQAYILTYRWHQHELAKSSTAASFLELPSGGLTPNQLRNISQMYSQERLRLLKSIEALLLLGEGWSGAGDFADVVEETLGELLNSSPGLEDISFRDLKDNLEGNISSGVPSQ